MDQYWCIPFYELCHCLPPQLPPPPSKCATKHWIHLQALSQQFLDLQIKCPACSIWVLPPIHPMTLTTPMPLSPSMPRLPAVFRDDKLHHLSTSPQTPLAHGSGTAARVNLFSYSCPETLSLEYFVIYSSCVCFVHCNNSWFKPFGWLLVEQLWVCLPS